MEEGLERFSLELGEPMGGAVIGRGPTTASVAILPSDRGSSGDPADPGGTGAPGETGDTVRFDQRNYQTREGTELAVITVQRRGSGEGEVSVQVATDPVSALPGEDYVQLVELLEWADGELGLKSASVTIIDDALGERTEKISLVLREAMGATIASSHGTASILIHDDDRGGDDDQSSGTLRFTDDRYQVHESEAEAFVVVERRGGNQGVTSVEVVTEAGSAEAGSDYEDVVATLTWGQGQGGTQRVSVPILPDDLEEGTETVLLSLRNLAGEAGLDPERADAELIILDDDSMLTECVPDDVTLCLQSGRFQVQATWRAADGEGGEAHADPLSDSSGTFWFFSPDNTEVLVKVLDACDITGLEGYWVFFAATTNVDFTVSVIDTVTGISKDYSNQLGDAAEPIQDLLTFQVCDA